MRKALIIVATVANTLISHASTVKGDRIVVINDDVGGRIIDYVLKYAKYERSGVRVEVRGHCQSACTYITGIKNVCAGPKAILSFHEARNPDGSRAKKSVVKFLENLYSPQVKAMITKKGGLSYKGWIHVKGTALLPPC
jgi:hypothetical protein